MVFSVTACLGRSIIDQLTNGGVGCSLHTVVHKKYVSRNPHAPSRVGTRCGGVVRGKQCYSRPLIRCKLAKKS